MSEPIRCFEGTHAPHEPFWTVRDAVEGQEPEIELYGYISEFSWFEDDVTPALFKAALYEAGQGGPVTLRINSYGGDVVAASVMGTILHDYPGEVHVIIDGIAASAATVVAVAGTHVSIQPTAYFMVHDPSVSFLMASLNVEQVTRLADSLAQVKEGIINAYEAKTGLGRTQLSHLMTEETWMSAYKALELGFVDEVAGGGSILTLPVMPAGVAVTNVVRGYQHVPEAVRLAMEEGERMRAYARDPDFRRDDESVMEAANAHREAVVALKNRIKELRSKERNHG